VKQRFVTIWNQCQWKRKTAAIPGRGSGPKDHGDKEFTKEHSMRNARGGCHQSVVFPIPEFDAARRKAARTVRVALDSAGSETSNSDRSVCPFVDKVGIDATIILTRTCFRTAQFEYGEHHSLVEIGFGCRLCELP
jgi:hypothetical protein